MARQIVVEIVGDARRFTGTLSDVTNQTTTLSGKLKNVGKGLAIGAGVAGFNLLTSAVSIAVSKMDEAHQAFLEDEASQIRLQNVLKNTVTNWQDATKAVEKYAQAQLDMGFDDAQTRDSVGQLVGVTHDYQKAIELATLSADIARAKNIDLATATDAVTRAYNGQARGLVALGIDVRGAAGGTQLLARAWQNVRGAQEAYAKTGAGAVAKANAKMQETMEKLGKAIDVVSQIVIPVMLTGFSGIVDFTGEVIKAISDLIDWLDQLVQRLQNVWAAATNATGPLGALLNIGKQALSIIPGGQILGGFGGNTTDFGGGVKSTHYGVPLHHTGGIVQGPYGSDQLIMAQAGERVIPTGQTDRPPVIINIASFIGSDRDIDRFADRLAFRLRATSLS